MSDHITVNIVVDNSGITRAGFGMPLILSHTADWAERVRFYSTILGVADDFATDSPEYGMASAFFAQTPHPEVVAIGRAANAVTQQYTVALGTIGPRDETVYSLNFKGPGFDDATATYTSDADATEDEILANLVTQINLVTDKTFTAVLIPNASDPSAIEITADNPNVWFSCELGSTKLLTIAQTHDAPSAEGLADDLDDILLESDAWYQLHTMFNSSAYVLDAADWVQSNGRIYVFDINETDAITTTFDEDTSTDTGAQLAVLGYSGTMGCYHQDPSDFFAAAWMGRWLPTDPGQAVAFGKTLEGVATSPLNTTHKTNLRARRMNFYVREFNRPITQEGTVFSQIYGYIDVRRNVDWLIDEVQKNAFGFLVGSDIVPYTPAGIVKMEGAVRGSVEGTAVDQGVLAPGTVRVEAPNFDDIPAQDFADRNLRNVKFFGKLAGAIQKMVPISGVVTF